MKPSTYPVLNNRPIDQWKVTELKEELKRRKLTTRGLKEELVRRLDEAIRSENEVVQEKVNNGVDDSHPTTEHIVVELEPVVDEITGPGSESTTTTDSQLANASIDHLNTEDGTLGETPTVNGNDGMPPLVEDPIQNEEALADVQAEGNDVSVTTIPAEVVNGLSDTLSYEASSGSSLFHFSGLEKEDKNSGAEQVLDDEKSPVKDKKLDLPDTAVQVSEVTSSLEFQVNHDSITSGPISVNEINDLKDDITADVKLELEAKPEMVQPLSDDVAPSGGESLCVEFEKQREDKVPVEQACSNTADIEMSERYTFTELGSPEKLNLDRSSGDDSMEEDASESKQLDSTYECVGEKSVETEMSVVKEESSVDATLENLSVAKNNSVQGEKKDGFVAGTEKRKLPDNAVYVIEPSKRQRRWNTAKNVKAVETDSVTALSLNITQDISQHSSPKSLTLSSSNSGHDTPKERIVPPPTRSPSNSLRIDCFLRPFTLKAVQDLLAKTGTVTSFWMDQIKTHCYVAYSSEEEAIKTRDALYNLQWPPNGGRLLVAEFVEPDEVKLRLEPPVPQPPTKPIVTDPAAPVLPAKPSLAPPHIPAIKPMQPPAKPVLPLPPPQTVPNPPPARGLVSPRSDAVPEKIDSPIVTLDDLFRKTKATPRIYYLPLTDEQVSSKIRNWS
ncbi:Apoptotic chromatin condensation inducer in the nucleus-like protein [Drosera capensis]